MNGLWNTAFTPCKHVSTSEGFLLFFEKKCRCRDTHHSGLSHAALQHAYSRRGETNWRPQGCQPKNWRATIPKTGGRPTKKLAGTNPRTGRPPYSFNLVFADKFLQSRPFVLVFTFLVDRAFEYVDARGAVIVGAQKEPFLTDADRPAIEFVSGEEGLRPLQLVERGLVLEGHSRILFRLCENRRKSHSYSMTITQASPRSFSQSPKHGQTFTGNAHDACI